MQARVSGQYRPGEKLWLNNVLPPQPGWCSHPTRGHSLPTSPGQGSVCTRCSIWIHFSAPALLLILLLTPSLPLCQYLTVSFSPSHFLILPSVSPTVLAFLSTESLQRPSLIFLYSFIPGEEVSILHLEIQLKFFTFSVFLSYHSGFTKQIALLMCRYFQVMVFFLCLEYVYVDFFCCLHSMFFLIARGINFFFFFFQYVEAVNQSASSHIWWLWSL